MKMKCCKYATPEHDQLHPVHQRRPGDPVCPSSGEPSSIGI